MKGEKVLIVPNCSSRNPAVRYETVLWEDGDTSCDCPGWTMHNSRVCRHTTKLRESIGRFGITPNTMSSDPVTGAPPAVRPPRLPRKNAPSAPAPSRDDTIRQMEESIAANSKSGRKFRFDK